MPSIKDRVKPQPGLHISFVGMGFFRLLKKAGAGNGVAGAASAFLIYAYGMMTGGSVSAMRAVGMFGTGGRRNCREKL